MPSEYIITNGQLVNVNDVKHHGVLGMKLGKRKAKNAQKDVRSAKYQEKYNNMLGKQATRSAEEKLKNVETINSLKAKNDRKGVKAEKKRYKLDSTIQRYEDHKKISKLEYDHSVNEAQIHRSQSSNKFAGLKDASLRRKLRQAKYSLKESEAIDNYYIAKAKGKKDPTYKKTQEYDTYIHEGRKVIGGKYVSAIVSDIIVPGALEYGAATRK